MKYTEPRERTVATKKEYVDGIKSVIAKRQEQAQQKRREYIKDVFSDIQKYRDDYRRFLGWPLVDNDTSGVPDVTAEKLSEEDGYTVYRMQIEVLDGLKLTGLFFRLDGDDKKPLVIVQHGAIGTPELVSGVYGDTTNYNDMLHRVMKFGAHAFAPQLLLWSGDYGVDYNRGTLDSKLRWLGGSITAVEIYGITRIIDYFEAQDYVSGFGMIGLSYGGIYSMYAAAAETRIRSSINCAHFSSRAASGCGDWAWFGSAEKFDDAEVACLVYPRRLCIEVGKQDELFDYKVGIESFEVIKGICGDVGTDWVDFIVFDGDHEFYIDDAPLERLVRDLAGRD